MTMNHREMTLELIRDYKSINKSFEINGDNLNISSLLAIADQSPCHLKVAEKAVRHIKENSKYLVGKVARGCSIYGVNTGYGGSADVRSDDILEMQRSLVRLLNAGFGQTLDQDLVKAVMVVRANSLARAYSGVRPEVVGLLTDMVNNDIIPIVPKRGSISASGDLMPTSYIAACMMGRPDAQVFYGGQTVTAPEALKAAGLEPIIFETKEALATVNSASFASSLGARVLFDGNACILLTQLATAMSVESLLGRAESFHPTVHMCLPHKGNQEVAANILKLLNGSTFTQQELDVHCEDGAGRLKQDRYALRSSPQWLGPAVETAVESVRRITTEINSANDNPLIDHRRDEILHCANFQGTAITVAMDQTRQALQLCGKLLFAQLSEILNVYMSNGLPPNLCGSDTSTDFGYKGTDIAMASYMSELDFLTNNVTNHVLSAEMHNQAVNSLGLISARYSKEALEILQMMLANIFNAHVQAIDLRFLQREVQKEVSQLLQHYKIDKEKVPHQIWPWYDFVFKADETASRLYKKVMDNGLKHDVFVESFTKNFGKIYQRMINGDCVEEVAKNLGRGTRSLYLYIRKDLGVSFYHAERALDKSLQKIFSAIQNRQILDVILDIFN